MKNSCPFCDNATVNDELTPKTDLSYMTVGKSVEGVNLLIRSGAGRPTRLLVERWNKADMRNVCIGVYDMKFCPECGRKLTENHGQNEDWDGNLEW